jgi:hypothetical protein
VALVDPNNAGKGPAGVVEDLLNHRQIDAQPRHSTRYSTPQIVHDPGRDSRYGKAVTDLAAIGRSAADGENVSNLARTLSNSRHSLDDCRGLAG